MYIPYESLAFKLFLQLCFCTLTRIFLKNKFFKFRLGFMIKSTTYLLYSFLVDKDFIFYYIIVWKSNLYEIIECSM